MGDHPDAQSESYQPDNPSTILEDFVTEYVLPELKYDYAALEPHISARIMELHHSKHHKAYVDGANAAVAKLEELRESGDYAAVNGVEKNLAFHLGTRRCQIARSDDRYQHHDQQSCQHQRRCEETNNADRDAGERPENLRLVDNPRQSVAE